MRTEEELRKDIAEIDSIYPQDKAISDYGSIEAIMAAYFQGMRMGLWVALGEIPLLHESGMDMCKGRIPLSGQDSEVKTQ